MTDVLNIEPKRWDWRAATGIGQSLGFTLLDGDDPITGSSFSVVIGGESTATDDLDDGDPTVIEGTEGDPGVYAVPFVYDTAGTHRLRLVLDDHVVTVGYLYCGHGGNESQDPSPSLILGDVSITMTVLGGGALQFDLKVYERDRVVPHVVRFDLENDGRLRTRDWALEGAVRTLVLDMEHRKLEPKRD